MNPEILLKVQKKPVSFIEKVLGCESMELYQKKICEDVAKYNRVAIAACHAVGKTFILARIVLWFLYCFRNSIVITTAPTSRQVESLLWGEIGNAVEGSLFTLGGHLTNKSLKIAKKWYAMGFSPQKNAGDGDDKEQKGSTFQGFHADYVLIVFDEAVGVPPDIWKQVEGLLTSGAIVKFVCIANPTTRNCDFYDCFKKPTWHKLYLNCFDSPNMIANGFNSIKDIEDEMEILKIMDDGDRLARIENYKKPVTHLISAQWVIEKALDWGIDHPLFQSKVLGEFPDSDDTVLIQEKTVELAQGRDGLAKEKGKRYIGIDVARYGDDTTVFTELCDADNINKYKEKITETEIVHTRTKKINKRDLMHITGLAVRFIMDDFIGEDVIVVVDATGLGSGVYDRLVELKDEKGPDGKPILPRKIKLVEIHYGGSVKNLRKSKKKATKKEEENEKTYHNIKAIMYKELDDALKKDMRLRKDSTYNTELPTIKYKFTSSGKMVIESKDDYKKRTGKNSPDSSDSLAMANLGRRFSSAGDFLKKLVR
jgi:hypothetical protein